MWLIFSLLAAGSESLKDIFSKFSSTKTDVYTASFSLHFFSILLILPFLFWDGIPQLKTSFWLGSIAFLIITPLWTILYMKALRVSEISKVMSLMAFNPLFTGLLAFAFSEIKPTRLGWAGIILVCVGVYVANSNLKVLHKDIFFPIKNIFSDPGALAMLGVAFLWSLGAHFSKMRVEGSSAVFSTFTGGVIGVVTTYLVAILKKQRIQFSTLLQKKWDLFPMGMAYFLSSIFSSLAMVSGTAAYVFTVKRASIAVSLITGKTLFNEKISASKVIGMICILGGIVLLALGN